MLKVLILAHGFPPFCHSGTFRTEALVRRLRNFGIEPIVFCGTSPGDVLPYKNPLDHPQFEDREYYRVYRTNWQRNRTSRWRTLLLRVPVLFSLLQQAKYLQLAKQLEPEIQMLVARYRPSVIYTTSPPHVTNVLGWYLARRTGLPWLCDQRDPWTFDPWAKYRHYVDFLLQKRFERKVLSTATTVVANTPTAKILLVNQIGIPENRVIVIPNGYDEDLFANHEDIPRPSSTLRIIYTGLLATCPPQPHVRTKLKRALGFDYRPVEADFDTRSAKVILPVIEDLLDRGKLRVSDIECMFVGAFSELDMSVFRQFKYQAILKVIAPVSQEEAVRLCLESSLLLLLQIHERVGGRDCCAAVPGKLYSYLRTPRPILAIMQESDAAEIVRKYDAGVVVSPYDKNGIANAILSFWEQFKREGFLVRPIHPSVREFEWSNIVEKIAKIMHACVELKNVSRSRA